MIYVCADPGSTHLGELSKAKELVCAAKEAGAHGIKFQLFRNEVIKAKGNIEFPRTKWPEVVEFANKKKIEVFASVFDLEAVNLVMAYGSKKIKLSFTNTFNIPFINHIRKHGGDMVVIASGNEFIFPSYADIRLYCQPHYPPKRPEVNIKDPVLWDGLSSHFLGYRHDIETFIKYSENFCFLEKHITLDVFDREKYNCNDAKFALLPHEFKKLVKGLKEVER